MSRAQQNRAIFNIPHEEQKDDGTTQFDSEEAYLKWKSERGTR